MQNGTRLSFLCLSLLVALIVVPSLGATPTTTSIPVDGQQPGAPQPPAPADDVPSKTTVNDETLPFENWGLSVAAAVEFFEAEYIETAGVTGPNRTVLVEKASKSLPAIWAGGNWTWDRCLWKCDWIRPGMFFGLKLAGQDGVGFEGLGVGFQLAFLQKTRLRSGEDGVKPSWNVGIAAISHKTRRLANGIAEGQPLPEDFQEVRFREGRDNSWMIFISKNVY